MQKLKNIEDSVIAAKGVQALPTRPNATAYGDKAMSAADLKAWFDKLATFIAGKINELQNTIGQKAHEKEGKYDGSEYIHVPLEEQLKKNETSLYDLIQSFSDGTFADKILNIMFNRKLQSRFINLTDNC